MNATPILVLLSLVGAGGTLPACSSSTDADQSASSAEEGLTSASGYYLVRNDTRNCAAPACGGYYVARANKVLTRCADGVTRSECYVADIDVTAAQLTDVQQSNLASGIGSTLTNTTVIVRATIASQSYPSHGQLGIFKATEAWLAPASVTLNGEFYMITDSGVRCPSAPCASFTETIVSSLSHHDIDAVDLSAAPGTDADQASAEDDAASATGLIVAGTETDLNLAATQFFVRVASGVPVGGVCSQDPDCVPGLLCCYPCSAAGCRDVCTAPATNGQCPVVP